jgi:hypothetical protein
MQLSPMRVAIRGTADRTGVDLDTKPQPLRLI